MFPGLLIMLAVSGAFEPVQSQDILSMQLQQGFGRNKVRYKDFDWHIIESPNVKLLYEPAFEDLAERAVEALERAYDHISDMLRHELSHKPPIVIYQSHYDFEQTNIIRALLPPGVAGFAEPLRYRVVTPFGGDLDEFERVLTHELTHIFQFDIVYRGPLKRLSNPLRSPPTWIMEGQAEYATQGFSTVDEMVLRDAVLSGELIPLEHMDAAWGYGNTFLMYKQSHSLMKYIAEHHGPEKISRMLRLWDVQSDTDKLLDRLIGMDMHTLDQRWSAQLRKQYWPMLEHRDYLDELGRKVVRNRDEYRMYMNGRWSLSGDMLAVLSTDGVERHVDIIRLTDGSLIERVTRGMRVRQYDNLTFTSGSLDWAPDGRTLAFVAKDGPRDRILLWDLYDKKVSRAMQLRGIDMIESLAWAPDSRHLALVGTGYGQSDIYILDTETEKVRQVTGSPQRDDYPAWSPDGRQLAFSSKRGGSMDIRIFDVNTGQTRTAIASPYDDMWPQWLPEGDKILFVSTRESINDLFVYHLGKNEEFRLTRTLNGVMNPSLSPDGRKILLSTYHRGRSELYVMDMPDWLGIRRIDAELAARVGESREQMASVSRPEGEVAVEPSVAAGEVSQDTAIREQRGLGSGRAVLLAGVSAQDYDSAEGARQASGAFRVGNTSSGSADKDEGSLEVPVSSLPRRPYTPKLEFDGIAVQMGYYDGFLSSIAQLSMSDLLGNHSLGLATDYVASQDIDSDFNFALSYDYFGMRPNFQAAVFNWSQYYNQWVKTSGGYISGLTRTRQTGFIGNVSYPLNLYRRVELNYTYVDEKESLVWPAHQDGPSNTTHLLKTAYVHDSVSYGLLGPTKGRSYYVAAGHTLDFSEDHRSFTHLQLDYRNYIRLGRWSVLGLRGNAVGSLGRDALQYNLGGPAWWVPFYSGFDLNVGPLRGYDYSELSGSRVLLLNAEIRVPFVRRIVFGWPTTFSIPAVHGSMFFDLGAAWNEGDDLELWPFHDPHAAPDPGGTERLRASFGFGTLVYFLLPLNFEWARQTDLRGNYSGYRFHFSLGRSF